MALPQVGSQSAFSTVLVATDLSSRSTKVLACAAALARQSNAKVLLAHVISPEGWHLVPPNEMHPALCHDRRTTEKKLANLLRLEALKGVQTDTVIRQGDFRQTLCNIAHEQHADLLVAGTHGRKGVMKLFMGSKAEEVCHGAPCPILLVGPKVNEDRPPTFGRLLFTTDLSTISMGALPVMLAFAEQHGSRLRILRIIAAENGNGANAGEFALAQLKAEVSPAITSRVLLASQPEFSVVAGSPREALLETAKEWGANVIGMGAHRPGSLSVYLPGDLAYDVACDANCPVLTIVD